MDTSMTRRAAVPRLVSIGVAGAMLCRKSFAQTGQSATSDQTRIWPNQSITGVLPGTNLEQHSGNLIVDQANLTIRGMDIRGSVTIKAPGVTIENCRVTTDHAWDWFVILTAGDTIVRNCTIDGGNVNEGQNAINGGGTFIRNDIFNTENGIAPGSNTIIEDNYIHDLKAPGSPHYDSIQIDGGQSNVSIRGNTIINPWQQTSAVMIDNWAGPISNIVVDDNLLVGGGYSLYVDGHFNSNPITGVVIKNNHFGGGHFGHVTFSKCSPVFTGNVYDGVAIAQKMGLIK